MIRKSLRVVVALVGLVTVLMAISISGDSAGRVGIFCDSVARWQHEPTFRTAADEYVHVGSDAMQTRFAGMSAETVVVGFRSIPGMPRPIRLSKGSAEHYAAFARGPLSAYLHLCTEQGVKDYIPTVEALAAHGRPHDDAVRRLLRDISTANPVATDDGAVRSVREMVDDVELPMTPFSVRDDIRDLLLPHVRAVARRLGIDPDPLKMSVDEQSLVLARLDAEVKETDRELWRTKQLNDLLVGIWAQAYGQEYAAFLRPVLRVRTASRVVMFMSLIAGLLWRLRSIRRKRAAWMPS